MASSMSKRADRCAKLLNILQKKNWPGSHHGADGGLAGVISERDVIRAIYEHGNDALNMPTDAFIVRDVHTCKNEDRAVDIAKVMAERRIRHVPIFDDGYLAGMVSATDIVKHYASKA